MLMTSHIQSIYEISQDSITRGVVSITLNNTTDTPRAFVLKPAMQLPAGSGRLALTLRDKQAAAVAPNVGVFRPSFSVLCAPLTCFQRGQKRGRKPQKLSGSGKLWPPPLRPATC